MMPVVIALHLTQEKPMLPMTQETHLSHDLAPLPLTSFFSSPFSSLTPHPPLFHPSYTDVLSGPFILNIFSLKFHIPFLTLFLSLKVVATYIFNYLPWFDLLLECKLHDNSDFCQDFICLFHCFYLQALQKSHQIEDPQLNEGMYQYWLLSRTKYSI